MAAGVMKQGRKTARLYKLTSNANFPGNPHFQNRRLVELRFKVGRSPNFYLLSDEQLQAFL
jgi:hypothetical protein